MATNTEIQDRSLPRDHANGPHVIDDIWASHCVHIVYRKIHHSKLHTAVGRVRARTERMTAYQKHFSLYTQGVFLDITSPVAGNNSRYVADTLHGEKQAPKIVYRENRPPSTDEDFTYWCSFIGLTRFPVWLICEIARRVAYTMRDYSFVESNCQIFSLILAAHIVHVHGWEICGWRSAMLKKTLPGLLAWETDFLERLPDMQPFSRIAQCLSYYVSPYLLNVQLKRWIPRTRRIWEESFLEKRW